MKHKTYYILGFLALALFISYTLKDDVEVHADINQAELNYYTSLDEEGNVKLLPLDTQDTAIDNALKVSEELDTDTSLLEKAGIIKNVSAINYGVVVFKSSENTNYKNYETNAAGYVNGGYAPDAAYLGATNDGYVIFKQAGAIGKVNASDVTVVEYTDDLAVAKYQVTQGKLYHKISTNLKSYASSVMVGYQQSYMTNSATYYSYDGHYFYKDYKTMLGDYINGTYSHSINPTNPYYSYYQFLSHRSKTTYTIEQINEWVNKKTNGATSVMSNSAQDFINNQNTYGVNALLMLGVAANESAWGTSKISVEKNNCFGHAAYDSNPDASASKYSSISESIQYHAKNYLSDGYLNPLNWKYFGTHLGDKQSGINVKYASDAYWGEKAAAQGYYMADYFGSKQSDYNHYDVKISATYVTGKKEASSSSKTLYNTQPTATDELIVSPVIVLSSSSGWYKIQSDAPLKSDRSGLNLTSSTSGDYDFDRDYVYCKTSTFKALSSPSIPQISIAEPTTPSTDTNTSVQQPVAVTIIKGDVSGDKSIGADDYMQVKLHVLGRKVLTGNALKAADVNGDGTIDASDYMLIKLHVLGRVLLK